MVTNMMMVITAVAATESYGNSNEEGGGMEASCLPKLPIVRSQPGSMLRVVIVSFSEQKNSRRAFACMYSFCTGWPSDGYILTSGFPPYASLLVGFSCTRADRFRWSVGSSAGSVQLIDPFFFWEVGFQYAFSGKQCNVVRRYIRVCSQTNGKPNQL